MAMAKRVMVLMGGWSAEREVSLVSGRDCMAALRDAGYEVSTVDVQREDINGLLKKLEQRPDVVFNALHGRCGEDGCIQGILNILGIPYTHSGLLASALAMDKAMAKDLYVAAGIPVAEHKVVSLQDFEAGDVMERPYVAKPVNEGSSVGIHIVREGDNRRPTIDEPRLFGNRVMVEKYIPGRELTVAVMGDRPLAVTEIVTERRFYDYDAKYADGGSKHVLPAQIDSETYDRAMEIAVRAHHCVGCRGVSRADFRCDGQDLYLLEVNTQPGMTPTSLVPEQAAYLGISFTELCRWIVEQAECDP